MFWYDFINTLISPYKSDLYKMGDLIDTIKNGNHRRMVPWSSRDVIFDDTEEYLSAFYSDSLRSMILTIIVRKERYKPSSKRNNVWRARIALRFTGFKTSAVISGFEIAEITCELPRSRWFGHKLRGFRELEELFNDLKKLLVSYLEKGKFPFQVVYGIDDRYVELFETEKQLILNDLRLEKENYKTKKLLSLLWMKLHNRDNLK